MDDTENKIEKLSAISKTIIIKSGMFVVGFGLAFGAGLSQMQGGTELLFENIGNVTLVVWVASATTGITSAMGMGDKK